MIVLGSKVVHLFIYLIFHIRIVGRFFCIVFYIVLCKSKVRARLYKIFTIFILIQVFKTHLVAILTFLLQMWCTFNQSSKWTIPNLEIFYFFKKKGLIDFEFVLLERCNVTLKKRYLYWQIFTYFKLVTTSVHLYLFKKWYHPM